MKKLLILGIIACSSMQAMEPAGNHQMQKAYANIADLLQNSGYLIKQTLHAPAVGLESIDDLADENRRDHLEIIQLKNNRIRHIPTSISLFTQLQDLDLSYNQLSELPDALGLLTQLKRLNVEHNCLTLLPCSVSELTELVFLLASDNQLTALPSLTRCKQLQVVQLANNKLTTVYDDNGNCIIPPTVWYLSIDGNQLSKNEMQTITKQ